MRTDSELGSTSSSYQILGKLATGGMAEIFLARGASAVGVERYVVLKRILRERASDVELVKMFLDEARLASQLQHPNIAPVYDIGKLGESYFFTMEYVHGETVRAILQRAHALRQSIPIPCVMSVIAGAAAGLHHAHERNGIDGKPLGIVHRDVSPSNLMVSFEGSVKVVDFGVAKAANRVQETRSGTVKGKISYLSPEQCRGHDLDRRSDLFSLGIVMWEMLAGRRLYRHDSDFENMSAIVQDMPPRPSTLRADVPAEVEAIAMRLLAKSRDDRFATADELLQHVEHAAMRAGTIISVSTLARYMKELFGQRPEPWVEMQAAEAVTHTVTVTGEAIPKELRAAASGSVDRDLAGVPDLGVDGDARGRLAVGDAGADVGRAPRHAGDAGDAGERAAARADDRGRDGGDGGARGGRVRGGRALSGREAPVAAAARDAAMVTTAPPPADAASAVAVAAPQPPPPPPIDASAVAVAPPPPPIDASAVAVSHADAAVAPPPVDAHVAAPPPPPPPPRRRTSRPPPISTATSAPATSARWSPRAARTRACSRKPRPPVRARRVARTTAPARRAGSRTSPPTPATAWSPPAAPPASTCARSRR